MNHSGKELFFLQTEWICKQRAQAIITVILPSSNSVLLKIYLHAKGNFYQVKLWTENTAAVAESPLRISIHGFMDTWITPEIQIRVEGNQMEGKLLFVYLLFQFWS